MGVEGPILFQDRLIRADVDDPWIMLNDQPNCPKCKAPLSDVSAGEAPAFNCTRCTYTYRD